MSLTEKLKTQTCPSEVVTIGGTSFKVTGLSLAANGRIAAKCTKNGRVDGNAMDWELLAACVSDPEDGTKASAEDWKQAPRAITGQLSSLVLKLNGFDKEDLSPKDSEPIES